MEAYYICGILNSPIVVTYFEFTFSKRFFSINFNIKIPLYNNSNKYQRKIAELAKFATQNDVTEDLLNDIQIEYINLCKGIQ